MKAMKLAPPALRRAIAAAGLAAIAAAAGPAFADPTQIAGSPLASTTSGTVKPNVFFVLDNSGSMAWGHAPDDVTDFKSGYGYTTSQCNSIYYDPSIKYVAPKYADGTSYPDQSFTKALYNGFDSTSDTVDLSTDFRAYDSTTGGGGSSASKTGAYYYVYSGSQTVPDWNTTRKNGRTVHSTWYNECNSDIGSTPGKNVFTKKTVSSTSGPGGTDERTNFANWYSYYRTRILMMKSGAGRAFSSIGSSYRVGFMTIDDQRTSKVNYPTSTDSLFFLHIADFDDTQKKAWYDNLYNSVASGGTPLREALGNAGRYYANKNVNSSVPDPVQYSCQQNFTILTTDGYWNSQVSPATGPLDPNGSSVGDMDSKLKPPFKDGVGQSNTLADAAQYYYVTDLRDKKLWDNCTGAMGVDVCENNVPVSGADSVATQHMTTFTLGLGVNGALQYSDDYLTGGSADYNKIVSGAEDWPKVVADDRTTVDDLWHAAVNGRGKYFSAQNPNLLVSGLSEALAGVSAREAAGAAAATSNLEPVTGDNSAFVANYRTVKWDGDVQSRTIDLITGAISNTANWSAQAQLDAAVGATSDSRTIFTYLNKTKVSFAPASFSAAQKTAWFTPTSPALTQSAAWTPTQTSAATADTLINYLRGQTGFEERGANTTQLYRFRAHVLGDIINGKPVYVKKPPFNYTENNYQTFKTSNALKNRQGVVYVAANDGMLHAFNSDTGDEMWAYVPSFVLPNLRYLADDDYANNHRYYVDGSPTVTDVWTGSAWATILVAGLNAGGKGYYALDITDPTAPKVLWEFSDANLGFTFGNPVIAKLTDGTWVVAFASGYNNADGVGRLYVLDAYAGTLKFTLSTGVGTATDPANLGKISAWVDDALNDNTMKRLYGGDMLGNLWRFDVNDLLPPSGNEATLLANFKTADGVQPITTVPELGLVGNKPVVFVGTGRYLGTPDVADVSQQSLYAIRDELKASGLGDARTESSCPLVQQTISALDANTRTTSTNAVDMNSNCGWYLDFPVPAPGDNTGSERVNVDPKLQLGVLAVATNIPANNICTVGGSSFLYFFDYATGQFVSTSTGHVAGTRLGNAIVVGLNTYRLPDGRVITTPTLSDDTRPPSGNPDNPTVGAIGKRVLWRELLN